jgi:hypothetical protein
MHVSEIGRRYSLGANLFIHKHMLLTWICGFHCVDFWDVTLCTLIVHRRFRGTYCHHLKGERVAKQVISDLLLVGCCSFVFGP